jgi:hypothetical protein
MFKSANVLFYVSVSIIKVLSIRKGPPPVQNVETSMHRIRLARFSSAETRFFNAGDLLVVFSGPIQQSFPRSVVWRNGECLTK